MEVFCDGTCMACRVKEEKRKGKGFRFISHLDGASTTIHPSRHSSHILYLSVSTHKAASYFLEESKKPENRPCCIKIVRGHKGLRENDSKKWV